MTILGFIGFNNSIGTLQRALMLEIVAKFKLGLRTYWSCYMDVYKVVQRK
jgi:hypothetical protein